MTSAIPVQCSTNGAIKPTGSWLRCEFVTATKEDYKKFLGIIPMSPVRLYSVIKPFTSIVLLFQLNSILLQCNYQYPCTWIRRPLLFSGYQSQPPSYGQLNTRTRQLGLRGLHALWSRFPLTSQPSQRV